MIRILVALFGLLLATLPAQAQLDLLPEIRGGIFRHDIGAGQALLDPTSISDANVELLFSPFGPALTPIELRPQLGATLNMRGAESTAYAGLAATFRVPLVPVFAEVSAGAAVHNGATLGSSNRFGCLALARVSGSVGVDVLPGTALMVTAEHYADGGLCGPSKPLTNVGVRLGLRF